MTTLPNLTDEQIVQVICQLPPDRQSAVLIGLANQAASSRDSRMQDAEANMRQICAERDLDWDELSDEERLNLIDDLVHEDRAEGSGTT